MAKGIPTPMENVPPKQTRDHAWHWGTILDSSPRPAGPSRARIWGGLVVAVVAGLLLGSSIVYAVMRDSWPPAGVIGLILLIAHGLMAGLGQLGHLSRLTRSDFVRSAAVYGATGLAGAVVTFAVLV